MRDMMTVLWIFAGIAFVLWGGAAYAFWSQRQRRGQNPFFLVFLAAWDAFRVPTLWVSVAVLWIIVWGMVAGAQISMILLVVLTTLAVVLLSLLAWKMWPQGTHEGNLLDLLPLPRVVWPRYENETDRKARVWVQEHVRELKKQPPRFQGPRFGQMVLEIAEQIAKIYGKKNIMAVQVEALLQGIERTAADMKILCNHLPLAGHLTLAEIEHQIQETVHQGKKLYLSLLLALSFVNPGNLLRVVVLLFQTKSPWEHVVRDLEAWVYANYAERLGYHLSLIYSEREIPPLSDLEEAIQQAESEGDQSVRSQKLHTLVFLATFGTGLYLLIQLGSATYRFGWPYLVMTLPILGALVYGIRELRSPKRWRKMWDALRPTWPQEQPALTQRDDNAMDKMVLVLERHDEPPYLAGVEDAKQLPAYYAGILWEIWQACFSSYGDPNDPNTLRATRAFYLPQGFAGIEAFACDLRLWYKGDSFFSKALRKLEDWGFGLDYLYQMQTEEGLAKAKKRIQQATALAHSVQMARNLASPKVAGIPTSPAGILAKIAKGLGNYIADKAKDYAVGEIHKRLLKLLHDDFTARLIDIYAARFPASAFVALDDNEEFVEAEKSAETEEKATDSKTEEKTTDSKTEEKATDSKTEEKATDSKTEEKAKDSKAEETKDSKTEEKTKDSKKPVETKEPEKTTSPQPAAMQKVEIEKAPVAHPIGGQGGDAPLRGVGQRPTETEQLQPSNEKKEEENKLPLKRLLLLSRDEGMFLPFLKGFWGGEMPAPRFEKGEVSFLAKRQDEHFRLEYYGLLWDMEEEDIAQKGIFRERAYHEVLLLEEIDYGARGRVAQRIKQELFEAMRSGRLGELCVILMGVEKLKPLAWEPPYDDYKEVEPQRKKSQRIRQAVMAWREAFASFHPVEMDAIFPLGLPREGEPWGYLALQKRLRKGAKHTV